MTTGVVIRGLRLQRLRYAQYVRRTGRTLLGSQASSDFMRASCHSNRRDPHVLELVSGAEGWMGGLPLMLSVPPLPSLPLPFVMVEESSESAAGAVGTVGSSGGLRCLEEGARGAGRCATNVRGFLGSRDGSDIENEISIRHANR